SIPLLILSDADFKTEENLELIAEREDITLATAMAAIFVSITFILCTLCYSAILRFLVKNRYSTSTAVKREGRLYVQMLGLFVGFGFFFVFNIVQFVFSLYSNVSTL
ncbi:hypothetical protein GCK32_007242, partial [Trichostrongylus colubriformis]